MPTTRYAPRTNEKSSPAVITGRAQKKKMLRGRRGSRNETDIPITMTSAR